VGVQRTAFGALPTGESVDVITIANTRGTEVRVATYGGIVLSLRVPDRDGRCDDVVLGHDDIGGYVRDSPYFGAIVGRYGNRIACGRFTLDGTTYELATNNGPHHLHGGLRGFDKAVWKCTPFERPGTGGVVLTHSSPDGDEGFPGTLDAEVMYTLNERDELSVDYRATTDRPTVLNLTQHSYFNLAADKRDDVLNHELTLSASRFTPVDETLIPLGPLASIEGTPFDFRAPTRIGARIDDSDTQMLRGGGYDHNFVLDRTTTGALFHAAHVHEPLTGRTLDVHTTEPGVQFYTGNFLDGSIRGKSGRVYGKRAGFCLETQHFPNSPNEPSFPSTVLRPGEEYRSRTEFRFGSRREGR
jgi:aldose 1-epimerase